MDQWRNPYLVFTCCMKLHLTSRHASEPALESAGQREKSHFRLVTVQIFTLHSKGTRSCDKKVLQNIIGGFQSTAININTVISAGAPSVRDIVLICCFLCNYNVVLWLCLLH